MFCTCHLTSSAVPKKILVLVQVYLSYTSKLEKSHELLHVRSVCYCFFPISPGYKWCGVISVMLLECLTSVTKQLIRALNWLCLSSWTFVVESKTINGHWSKRAGTQAVCLYISLRKTETKTYFLLKNRWRLVDMEGILEYNELILSYWHAI